jgi:hypothetical protein
MTTGQRIAGWIGMLICMGMALLLMATGFTGNPYEGRVFLAGLFAGFSFGFFVKLMNAADSHKESR